MSPVTITAIDVMGQDLRGVKFGDMTDRVITGCNLANTDWSTAKVKRLHLHDCTGVTPKFTITCCWYCGGFRDFSDEKGYRAALTHAFNMNQIRVVAL